MPTLYETKVHIGCREGSVSENHPGLKSASVCGDPETLTDYRNQNDLSCLNGFHQQDLSLVALWSVDIR